MREFVIEEDLAMRLQIKNWVLVLIVLMGGRFFGVARALGPDLVIQAVVAEDGVQHVRIVGGSYFFKPNRVVVKVGVPVELTLSREDGLIPHVFVIHAPESGINVDQSLSTAPQTIRFTPTALGRYPFYCKNRLLFFKSHREEGMEGILEVVE